MTQTENDFPYYRTPSRIRSEVFSHRMRGFDEDEVREYLSLLADQVQATEVERTQIREENDRLRRELERLQAEPPRAPEDEISPQAVVLFSQAQQVADQLVEEAVVHARDLMASARSQQRQILEQAHAAATSAARQAAQAGGAEGTSDGLAAAAARYDAPIPEIEYVRTFARVAQVQLRSVLEALTEQVDKLGQVPQLDREDRTTAPASEPADPLGEWDWRNDPVPGQRYVP